MKVLPLVAVFWVVSLATLLPVARAGDYIVVLKDSVGPGAARDAGSVATARRAAKAAAQRHRAAPSFVYAHALRGYAATLSDAALARAQTDPDVAFVAVDREFSIHEPVNTGESSANAASLDTSAAAGDGCSCPAYVPSQLRPFGMQRIGTLLSPTAKVDRVDERIDADIAILDTGIKATHPDLNVVGGVDCTSKKGDFNDDDRKHSHGTHVAGTAAAIDNEFGVVGVAPGARLWAVKVLKQNGTGTESSILCGIEWVTAHSEVIDVANMSLGGPGSDDGACGTVNKDPVHIAICDSVASGVTYVVSAGNASKDAAGLVPASYDEVITVSALADCDGRSGGLDNCGRLRDGGCLDFGCLPQTTDDSFACFSNFGADIDIAAPGVCIGSTWISSRKCQSDDPATACYGSLAGTSMASPHVAGAAALYKATHPSASPADVKAALIDNWEAGPIPDDPDTFPEGVVNVSTF